MTAISDDAILTLHDDIFWKARTDPRTFRASQFDEHGFLPYYVPVSSDLGREVIVGGEHKLMFGSNNYLALTTHPRVIDAARRALDRFGSGCTGSRLMVGTLDLHVELEAELAEWVQCEDSLVFATGYMANLGLIDALCGPGDVVIGDVKNHASISDGARMSGATTMSVRHNDMVQLEQKLRRLHAQSRPTLVVWDAVFSMEGDLGPVAEICSLARRYGARTMIDEAHSLGLLGPEGSGLCIADDASPDLIMGTFTKSLASCGGFIAGDRDVIEYLKAHCRPFVFTAAAAPAVVAAALEALRVCREETWRAARVIEVAERLATGLAELSLEVGWYGAGIVSIPLEDEWNAVRVWRELLDQGVYVNVAVFPAVERGKASIRMTMTATHTDDDIERCLDAFGAVDVAGIQARGVST